MRSDLDVSQEFPEPFTGIVVRAADFVITMGCGEACPIYPRKHYEDWAVNDPPGTRSRWYAPFGTTSKLT